MVHQVDNSTHEQTGAPKADMGNASNPTAEASATPDGPKGLLDERADKYIREVASIEDLPDDEDQQAMEDQIRKEDKA